MISKRKLSLIALACTLFSCAPARRFYLHNGNQTTRSDLDRVLAENPMAPGENIKITHLGADPAASHHIVQVRDREAPHIHREHDGTVVLLRGQGFLMMGQSRLDLTSGDVVFIPRNTPHYFVNTSPEPAAAFVVFSPPFDGKDIVPVSLP
jgi:mannose-6-phosphate isomerase-like protein (cupin superfamily)